MLVTILLIEPPIKVVTVFYVAKCFEFPLCYFKTSLLESLMVTAGFKDYKHFAGGKFMVQRQCTARGGCEQSAILRRITDAPAGT